MEHAEVAELLSPASRDFIAGAAGGMAGVVAGQPLDTLRIRLQQRLAASSSILDVWRSMAGNEGWKALFKGMSYPLVTTALQNATTFHGFGIAKRYLAADSPQDSSNGSAATICLRDTFLAGMFAGVVQSFVGAPVDLLKIRLQLQQAMPGSPGYVGPLALLRSILRSEGVAGVWRGTTITMLRDTPSYGLYFVVYDVCCDRLKEVLAGASASKLPAAVVELDSVDAGRGPGEVDADAGAGAGAAAAEWVEPAAQFLAGGLAGVLAWGSIYPLDVIKSRIQAAPASKSDYRGWWDCAVKSCREEGAGALTRGMGATLSRAFLVNAAIFAVYEACLSALCAPAAPS